jgi:hypothetical protein
MRFKLIRTCFACPEQYDVLNADTGEKIAYLRLRHGRFRMDYPWDGPTVFEGQPDGDGLFENEGERSVWIGRALLKLREICQDHAAIAEYKAAIKEGMDSDE